MGCARLKRDKQSLDLFEELRLNWTGVLYLWIKNTPSVRHHDHLWGRWLWSALQIVHKDNQTAGMPTPRWLSVLHSLVWFQLNIFGHYRMSTHHSHSLYLNCIMSVTLLEETFITVINRQAMAFITLECKKAWPFGGLLKECMTVEGGEKTNG